MKKTWQQKLEDKDSLPKVLRLERGFPCYNGVHRMGADVGEEAQMKLLEQEGHAVIRRGKKYQVQDYQTHLV